MDSTGTYNAGEGRILLSRADKEWQLANNDQNIIGWKVLDTKGQRVGVVADMIVDTVAGYVDSVLLDTGSAISTNDINIGDRIAYMSTYHMKVGVVERITVTKRGVAVRIKLDEISTRRFGSNVTILRDGRRFVKVPLPQEPVYLTGEGL